MGSDSRARPSRAARMQLRYWLSVMHCVSAPVWRKPWLAVLGILGVALGAAVVVAIELAADSASRAHARSVRSASGAATHQIHGGPAGIPEQLYVRIRLVGKASASMAVMEGSATLPSLEMRRVGLLGIDLLAGTEVRDVGISSAALRPLLQRGNAVAMGAGLVKSLQLELGSQFEILIAGSARTVTLTSILRTSEASAQARLDGQIVADIAVAQELLERPGVLTRIDLKLDGEAATKSIEALLGAGDSLVAVSATLARQQGLTSAFNTNLSMMGKLALLIGLLLVYNTMTFSIIARRERFGVLRALGLLRSELFVAVLVEALVIGIIAALIGIALGFALASVLLGLVAQTLNDLYFSVDARNIELSYLTMARAGALAVAGAMVAACVPACEALQAAPATVMRRSAAESDARRSAPWLALLGLVVVLAGAIVLLVGTGLNSAFAGLFMLVTGAVMAVPWGLVYLLPSVATGLRLAGFAVLGFAVDGVRAAASRSSVAVAALTVALAATLGVGIMIESFRGSVESWLRISLPASLYVSQPGAGPRAALPSDLIQTLRADPRVAALSRGRGVSVNADSGPVDLIALDPAPLSYDAFLLLDTAGRSSDVVWQGFGRGEVLVSEPFAERHALAAGATVRLQTRQGWRAFPIAAIYRDYAREAGAVLIDMHQYQRHWADLQVSSLGIYVVAEEKTAELALELREYTNMRGIQVRANSTIRDLSLAVFDRTFAITQVLRGVTIAVAFVGVFSALMALQLERQRELAILRATGATRWQVALSVIGQTGAMGVFAGVFAVPLGALVGYVLVTVVNTRSFGWTLDFSFNPALAAQALALSVGAAVLAGVYPALRLARQPVAAALRME